MEVVKFLRGMITVMKAINLPPMHSFVAISSVVYNNINNNFFCCIALTALPLYSQPENDYIQFVMLCMLVFACFNLMKYLDVYSLVTMLIDFRNETSNFCDFQRDQADSVGISTEPSQKIPDKGLYALHPLVYRMI